VIIRLCTCAGAGAEVFTGGTGVQDLISGGSAGERRRRRKSSPRTALPGARAGAGASADKSRSIKMNNRSY